MLRFPWSEIVTSTFLFPLKEKIKRKLCKKKIHYLIRNGNKIYNIYLLKIDTDNIKYLSIKKIRQVVNRKVVNVHRYLKIHTEVTQLRTYATFNGSRVGIIENL